MKTFEVQLQTFSGPIDTLLDLIESRKLSITDITLSDVTADFLRYVHELAAREEGDSRAGASSRLIADFLVIAAHLLLIKSKVLLPSLELSPEEEEGIKDLETRLRILKLIRRQGDELHALWSREERSFSRPFLKDQPIVFYPAPNITPDSLGTILRALWESLEREAREVQTLPSTLLSLEERVQDIMNRLAATSRMRGLAFGNLASKKTKQEIVVLFLALLHLLEQRLVQIEQKKHFSDIIVKSRSES